MRRLNAAVGCRLLFVVVIGVSARPDRVSATVADDLCMPAADPCRVSTAVTVTDMSVIDVGQRELLIDGGGALAVGPGTMTLRGLRVRVAAGGSLTARGSASLPGGNIIVQAGQIEINGSVTASGESGGDILLVSTGALTLAPVQTTNGIIEAKRISGEGGGGNVELRGQTVSVAGLIDTLGGNFGFGGDVTINALGDLMMTGRIDAQGGDGGTVELNAGFDAGSGNVTVTETAVIDADAGGAGGFGGSIDLDADGDGTATGNIVADGVLLASGGTGTEETGGGDGGAITITADGDVTVTNEGARLVVQGARPDGFGGEIEISSNSGALDTVGQMAVSPVDEASGGGGDITIDAREAITIAGEVLAIGGSEVLIESTGNFTLAAAGTINVSDGGSICISSGASGSPLPARLLINGELTANAGAIELTGRDAVVLTEVIRADGAGAGGDGGIVSILTDEGPALLNDLISVAGRGADRAGGTVAVEAEERINAAGQINATGTGGSGGTIGLRSEGPVDVAGTLTVATSSVGRGGRIEIISADDLSITGSLRADGGSASGSMGGSIEIEGCAVNINEPAELRSQRPNGLNRVTGRDETLVLGRVLADNQTGRNEFRYNGAQRAPVIFGTVQPMQTLLNDPTVVPCVVCGNQVTEPPETCDDGNEADGDGCSRTCQIETTVRGDANGDGILDTNDIAALLAEIYDGDGDNVADVGSPTGSFAGDPGADANDDERITTADLTAILALLFP